MAVLSFAEQLLELHFKQLQRLVERRGVAGVRRLYLDAQRDLAAKVRHAAESKSAEDLSRFLLAQLRATADVLSGDVTVHLANTSKLAAEMGARHGIQEFSRLERHYRGTTAVADLDRASVFAGMAGEHHRSLLQRHMTVTSRWSAAQVESIEKMMATGALAMKTRDELVNEAAGRLGLVNEERWRAERIVRTELHYAHSAVKFEAMKATEKKIGSPLFKRLIETFDDRTGDDSFILHGQTVPLSKPFVWKRKTRKGGWVVEAFMFPPNRPNDRAVVIPWDPTWEETEGERPLTKAELLNARPTRWRASVGVDIPPGHRPGKPAR